MKNPILALGAVILAVSLAACGTTVSGGASGASQPAVEPLSKSAPTPTPDEGKKSPRGNTIKALGEPSYWKKTANTLDQDAAGWFTVTEIKDITCDQPYASAPTNGKLIGLVVDVETKASLAEETPSEVFLSPFTFKYIGPSGTTFNGNLSSGATIGCIDRSLVLASSFGPSEKAHGIILLDVPSAGGVLTAGKVEWNLP
jgi:hypothetical protein